LVFALAGFYLFFHFKNKNRLDKAFGARLIPWLTQSIDIKKRHYQFVVQILALCFLILALARPQLGQSSVEVKSQGIEMMILADVSQSMMAEDVRPSRLEQMKIELDKLIDLMPGNKMGLVAFAGSSALLSPLTSDPGALKLYIHSLDTEAVSSQGTNFESALTLAHQAFNKGGITQDQGNRTTRVMLVVSDGEDQEPNALKVAEDLSKEGIKIITLAYGTEKGGSIPVRDRFGNLSGAKKDKSGQTIITQVKGEFLQKLADTGKGKFFFAVFGGNHLREIMKEIESFEQSQFDSSFSVHFDEQFIYPLSLAFVLLVLSLLISDRNDQKRQWKGFYEL
jgi:Ca-activated chloride channel homolog